MFAVTTPNRGMGSDGYNHARRYRCQESLDLEGRLLDRRLYLPMTKSEMIPSGVAVTSASDPDKLRRDRDQYDEVFIRKAREQYRMTGYPAFGKAMEGVRAMAPGIIPAAMKILDALIRAEWALSCVVCPSDSVTHADDIHKCNEALEAVRAALPAARVLATHLEGEEPWSPDLTLPPVPGIGITTGPPPAPGEDDFYKCPSCGEWFFLDEAKDLTKAPATSPDNAKLELPIERVKVSGPIIDKDGYLKPRSEWPYPDGFRAPDNAKLVERTKDYFPAGPEDPEEFALIRDLATALEALRALQSQTQSRLTLLAEANTALRKDRDSARESVMVLGERWAALREECEGMAHRNDYWHEAYREANIMVEAMKREGGDWEKAWNIAQARIKELEQEVGRLKGIDAWVDSELSKITVLESRCQELENDRDEWRAKAGG